MHENKGSTTVAIRLVTAETLDIPWQQIPIAGHLPLFLGEEGNQDNINRRIRMIFLKRNPKILKACWHFNHSQDIHWVFPESKN